MHSDWFLYLGTGGIATLLLIVGIASMLGLSQFPQQENSLWFTLFGTILYGGLYIHWAMMRKMKH